MPAVQRVGDVDSGGGVITSGVDSVRINGIPVSVNGSGVSPHARRNSHRPVTAGGVDSVMAGGSPINVAGNADTCGHARTGGSSNVSAG
jgi:uncharacterized Zn-binding protein involved in type VI secretion